MFRALAVDNFNPFGRLEITFPPVENKPADLAEVHLLTGVNGTGKTRILSVLSACLGNFEPLSRRIGVVEKPVMISAVDTWPPPNPPSENWPNRAQIQGQNFNWVVGGSLHTWVHEVAAFAYGGMPYVVDANINVMADVPRPDRQACLAFVRLENSSNALLQAISNLKVQAAMDALNSQGVELEQSRPLQLIGSLEAAITKITGLRFVFIVTAYPKAVLEVIWGKSKLAFSSLPDGLRSIIGWLAHAVVMMDAWFQGRENPLAKEAIFLLDEVEGSLHPAWQRKILPAFQRLFPKAQMFVATHSPFLIASLNHGWIHPLAMNSDGSVRIEKVVAASEGDSYVSVVEDIMGVKEWYDPETEKMLSDFREKRDAAFNGDGEAQTVARKLAAEIGCRSMELEYMMGRELRQMDRQLNRREA